MVRTKAAPVEMSRKLGTTCEKSDGEETGWYLRFRLQQECVR
jgi:hypothetical protein